MPILANIPTLPNLTLFREAVASAKKLGTKPAIVDITGQYSYGQLLGDVVKLKEQLTGADLKEEKVAYLCPNGYNYVVTQWSIWASGGVAVPLCASHPPAEMEYSITDSEASIVISSPEYEQTVKPLAEKLGKRYICFKGFKTSEPIDLQDCDFLDMDESRHAMIMYTSGTTGKPKGVVSTHTNIKAQVTSLVEAWKWTSQDKLLHVLPLHHTHGVIVALTCGLWSGATVEMMRKFNANDVWERFMAKERDLTLFMAVPTIYAKLRDAYHKLSPEKKTEATESCKQFRLMISGSAPLPSKLLNEWEQISHFKLLERYGMTEIGMALSNPIGDPALRKESCVGLPLPGVEVRLKTEDGRIITSEQDVPGEIQVRGDNVFKEYYNRPEATRETFDQDRWFKTGDIGCITTDGYYKILGRASTDIIKSGGYKISALEIEREILDYPGILDCAVVGPEDEEWGQKVAAVVLVEEDQNIELQALRDWASSRLAKYKLPSLLHVYKGGSLPRNVMGKVNKKQLVKIFDQAKE
ncbi:AMP-dependent synthetase and ligase [Basidiobolus meristosporus CBS 931.73]|uniref:AMP-dependent synthetase and ligase n=1 Tax=Basidiobolus meristosporus CBS 931.73 TaxID=1314790 RepID=A0A1Y1Z755_9FUNG|nr:AMP-dependent synthetase and ligase [Basidiobolus meristosporus CBS 931.73]|eukprot:ORY06112.1 AMP-dependent synthetase and ligase [Basidiobolus meristosporus CBS 931.73]